MKPCADYDARVFSPSGYVFDGGGTDDAGRDYSDVAGTTTRFYYYSSIILTKPIRDNIFS